MRYAVPLIVIAQLFGTSLWFSANGVGDQLLLAWGLSTPDLGSLTSAVQLGFITGTLLFAVSGTADRFHASRLFLLATVCGALANLGLAWVADSLSSALAFRFITGLALAGIYPVGMKLVVSWAPQRRGEALAWLVGMLTLGTATPHLLQGLGVGLGWPWVVSLASMLAVLGGVMVALLGDGPHLPRAARLNWGGVFAAFRRPGFRAAAFGYFGHMWELYALWVLVPLLLAGLYPEAPRQTLSMLAFA
ncbi:MAG TPA: MFS transporter, partial [Thioalkalivibrio sp.]|nr:MFS transporter [Thioalkalivibrio sp.]